MLNSATFFSCEMVGASSGEVPVRSPHYAFYRKCANVPMNCAPCVYAFFNRLMSLFGDRTWVADPTVATLNHLGGQSVRAASRAYQPVASEILGRRPPLFAHNDGAISWLVIANRSP